MNDRFYKCFGIEIKDYYACDVGTFCPYEGASCDRTCPYYRKYRTDYPPITDRMLLELICIYARREVYCFPVVPANEETWTVSKIKENILEQLIYLGQYSNDKELVKDEVRKLFEKGVI